MTFRTISRSQVKVSARVPSVIKGHGSDAETATYTSDNLVVFLSGFIVDVVVIVVVVVNRGLGVIAIVAAVAVGVVSVVVDGKPAERNEQRRETWRPMGL